MNATKIMCPIDFSDYSDVALGYASQLASESGATLFLIHVDDTQVPYDAGFAGYVPPPHEAERMSEILRAKRPTVDGVPCEHHLLVGHPADAIVEFSKAHGIDLIVMGTHGRTGVSRFLMGSIAEAVVRQSECPVLTVKQPARVLNESS